MEKIPALTGARAIAAFAVLFAHAIDWTFGVTSPATHEFCARLAYFGMSLFFCLSGFVIDLNYRDSLARGDAGSIYRFFVARFARLYPLYAAVLVYSFFSSQSRSAVPPDHWAMAWSHVTLTQSWINAQSAFYHPAWSISTEAFFYVAFVFLAAPVTLIQRPLMAWLIATATIIVLLTALFSYRQDIVYFFVTYIPHLISHGSTSNDVWFWLIYMSPILRFFDFLLGVLASRMWAAGIKIPTPVAAVCVLWCALVLWKGSLLDGTTAANALPNFIFAPAITLLLMYVSKKNASAYILSFPLFVFAGEISYSIYMLEGLVFGKVRQTVADPFEIIFWTVLLTTFYATVSYFFVERPARYWLRFILLGFWQKRSRALVTT